MNNKKYYWLKLDKNFFKRHDIRIVESMPNGKDYILFYLKLLCESTSHEGALRFSENIPYSQEMLATITNTNIDIVRSAINIFTNLKMMEILEDKTIFMLEVNKMLGCETEWAVKKRAYREQQKELSYSQKDNSRTFEDNVLQELEKEIEKDKEIDIYIKEKEKENVLKEKERESFAKNAENLQKKDIFELQFEEKELEYVDEKEMMFDKFWQKYPRKVNKKGAKTSFLRIKNLKKEFDVIMQKLDLFINSKQWKDNNGQFIPHPQTWINQERWKDETREEKERNALEEWLNS